MWSYLGSKKNLIRYYPKPKYKTIIEPFAGSAQYALHYWDHDIILIDKDENVVRLWKWLQSCSKDDILSLPVPNAGDTLDKFTLSPEEKLFMDRMSNIGTSFTYQGNKVSPFAADGFIQRLLHTSSILQKIRHWKIICGNYSDAPDYIATWFIDPPYQFNGGHRYRYGNKLIDYEKLGVWCKQRKGQIIVCEGQDATWLPFVPIKKTKSTTGTPLFEMAWYCHNRCPSRRTPRVFNQPILCPF